MTMTFAQIFATLVLAFSCLVLGWNLHEALMPQKVVCGWYDFGRVAQPGEHGALNPAVGGSNPPPPAKRNRKE